MNYFMFFTSKTFWLGLAILGSSLFYGYKYAKKLQAERVYSKKIKQENKHLQICLKTKELEGISECLAD